MSEESRFNPSEHLMQLKSKEGNKDYLPVQWRLVWFREQCPQGVIETEMVHLDLTQAVAKEVSVWNAEKRRSDKTLKEMPGIAVFRAKVSDGRGGVATGYGSESALDFGDFLEKAETKAIGRALAALGYGTQFAPELEEGARIVDAPVDRAPVSASGNGSNHANSSTTQRQTNGSNPPSDENAGATATEQQVASIRKLCQYLDKSEPNNVTSLSFEAAKQLIQTLTAEYKASRQSAESSPEPASPALVEAARKLYVQLGREVPTDLGQKSALVIRRLMEQMNGEHRESINAKNGHAPTSTVNAPSVANLRKRAVAMKVDFDDQIIKECKRLIPDDNITPETAARLKERLDIIASQRSNKAATEKKAS